LKGINLDGKIAACGPQRSADLSIQMSEPQPVLVIGGTRGTGLLIAGLLQQRGQRVRVFARDPERAAKLLDSSVEIVAGDLTKPETLPPAVSGIRHVIFTAGCRSGYPLPVAWRYRIARADRAAVFLAALAYPKASRTTFEAVWGRRGEPQSLPRLMEVLQRDDEMKG